jgi:uncharacterized membrane protein YeaQ/YmgE (transglycosylase-associated protein family)
LAEALEKVSNYLQPSPILSLVVAVIAGLAAVKTVAYDQRPSFVLFVIVGVLGLFLGEFMLFYFRFDEILENIAAMRILFDLIAAYIGSFIIAAVIHFIKPT